MSILGQLVRFRPYSTTISQNLHLVEQVGKVPQVDRKRFGLADITVRPQSKSLDGITVYMPGVEPVSELLDKFFSVRFSCFLAEQNIRSPTE
jgi:hypothetical protein